MKAAVLTKYDKNGRAVELREMPIPKPEADEVLVKIYTAGVNPLDNMILRGEVKMIVPYSLPLVMGNEFVGIVEKAGADAIKFPVGSRVYGRMPLHKIGAFAEYAAVKESAIALVPDYLSNEEAACVPLTALTAVEAFELMQPKAGESVFISGGTGSLGAMAIPIAKSYSLTVFTNGNGENKERILSLGADKFFDYKKEDYADYLSEVDFVLDTLGDRELPKEFSILKRGGKLVSLRALPNGAFARRFQMPAFKRALFKLVGGKYDKMAKKKNQTYDFIFVRENGAGLEKVNALFSKENPIKTSLDGVYSLEQVNEALQKVKTGRSKGKTVLRICE